MEDLVKGQFEEAIGLSIDYLTFLFVENEGAKEPVFAWMRTSDFVWHRFFIDAWMPHWNNTIHSDPKKTYDQNSIQDYVKEELEEYDDADGRQWRKVDVLKAFDFKDKKIVDAQSVYNKVNGYACTQIILEIEDSNTIILNDYGDIIKGELIINGTKI